MAPLEGKVPIFSEPLQKIGANKVPSKCLVDLPEERDSNLFQFERRALDSRYHPEIRLKTNKNH